MYEKGRVKCRRVLLERDIPRRTETCARMQRILKMLSNDLDNHALDKRSKLKVDREVCKKHLPKRLDVSTSHAVLKIWKSCSN